MGSLSKFNLQQIKDVFHVNTLFETGTGTGNSTMYAVHCQFDKIYSCEIHKETYDAAVLKFMQFPNVEIINSSSFDAINNIIPTFVGESILFWLDAHFPGEVSGIAYNAEKDHNIRLPLQLELETICKLRNTSKDVFIIDDLRLYEPGNYVNGQLDDIYKYSERGYEGIEFIEKLFGDTHQIQRSYEDEGYLILFPKVIS